MILAFQFVLPTAVFDPFSLVTFDFRIVSLAQAQLLLILPFSARAAFAAGHHVHSHPGNVFPWFFTF